MPSTATTSDGVSRAPSRSNCGLQNDEEDTPRTMLRRWLAGRDGRHVEEPFSLLNELHQARHLTSLNTFDHGSCNGWWTIRVTLLSPALESGALTSFARARSKRDAKHLASRRLLDELSSWVATAGPRAWDRGEAAAGEVAVQPRAMYTAKQMRRMAEARTHLALARDIVDELSRSRDEGRVVCVAIDVEWHEGHERDILEIGLAWVSNVVGPGDSGSELGHGSVHLVNEDLYDVRNGVFVPDHKDDYAFGQSEVLPSDRMRARVDELTRALTASASRVFLVGHSIHQDLRVLAASGLSRRLVAASAATCDIALAYCARYEQYDLASLENMLRRAGVIPVGLHNAGNDARHTVHMCMLIGRAETGMGGSDSRPARALALSANQPPAKATHPED